VHVHNGREDILADMTLNIPAGLAAGGITVSHGRRRPSKPNACLPTRRDLTQLNPTQLNSTDLCS